MKDLLHNTIAVQWQISELLDSVSDFMQHILADVFTVILAGLNYVY